MTRYQDAASPIARAASVLAKSPELKARIMRDAIAETVQNLYDEGNATAAYQTRAATDDADDATLAKLYDLMFVSSDKPDALRRVREGAASAGYTQNWTPGQMLTTTEDSHFYPAGTVVVFKARTFAPFVKLLVPGYAEDALGHFPEDKLRPATPEEIHAALRSVRENA